MTISMERLSKCNLFWPWYGWKKWSLGVKQQSDVVC